MHFMPILEKLSVSSLCENTCVHVPPLQRSQLSMGLDSLLHNSSLAMHSPFPKPCLFCRISQLHILNLYILSPGILPALSLHCLSLLAVLYGHYSGRAEYCLVYQEIPLIALILLVRSILTPFCLSDSSKP